MRNGECDCVSKQPWQAKVDELALSSSDLEFFQLRVLFLGEAFVFPLFSLFSLVNFHLSIPVKLG